MTISGAEVPAASLDYDGSNPGGVAADLGEERVLLVELGSLDWATQGSSQRVVVLELFDHRTASPGAGLGGRSKASERLLPVQALEGLELVKRHAGEHFVPQEPG